jgi:hypothetical protein
VFRIRIRPDPKLFGRQDPDPKLLISDPAPDPALDPDLDPSLFHTKLRICFKNALKSEKIIIISYTILENSKS